MPGTDGFADDRPVSGFTGEIVMRGYNRRQVEEYLARLDGDPKLAEDPPAFDVGWRGYHRDQVDEYIELVLNVRRGGGGQMPAREG